MPFAYGALGIHTGLNHTGDATRDAVGGVAGLTGSGNVLSKGPAISLPRDGTNDTYLIERTANERSIQMRRIAANDYDLFVYESGVMKQAQTESMKDVASGITSLDASGNILAPGNRIYLTRDVTNTLVLQERTANEAAFTVTRAGVNDYDLFVNESGLAKQVQTAGMKDVASGIVAQDASGIATVTGNAVSLTRSGANIIGFMERTSGETVLYLTRKGVNRYQPYIAVGGGGQLMAILDANGDIPHMRPKAASANLRHSNDPQASTTNVAYTLLKTDTFANGITGTLRIYYEMANNNALGTSISNIFKNGVAVGTQRTTNGAAWVPYTEDINVGVLAPGDTIEIRGYQSSGGGYTTLVQNFRISYDNAADTILVAGVTAT